MHLAQLAGVVNCRDCKLQGLYIVNKADIDTTITIDTRTLVLYPKKTKPFRFNSGTCHWSGKWKVHNDDLSS